MDYYSAMKVKKIITEPHNMKQSQKVLRKGRQSQVFILCIYILNEKKKIVGRTNWPGNIC